MDSAAYTFYNNFVPKLSRVCGLWMIISAVCENKDKIMATMLE